MTNESLLERLTTLTEPLAASLGLSLWGIDLAFGGRSLLRVYVEDLSHDVSPSEQDSDEQDKTDGAENATLIAGQGVTIEQCAELSRLLGLTLDVEEDSIPGAYVLEVSSPGLDRRFFTAAQLAGAVGKPVEITLLQPHPDLPGRKRLKGVLISAPQADAAGHIAPDADFVIRAEDPAKPEAEGQDVAFAFQSARKAKQIYEPPQKALPGKSGGKKKKEKTE